jgi:hypothetical protein
MNKPMGLTTAGPATRYRFHRPMRWATLVALAVALVAVLAPLSQKARAATQTPRQHLPASNLTAVWWQWAFSVSVSENALFDEKGDDAFNGQPCSDRLFLGGTFVTSGTPAIGRVTRSISVKRGTALFFPLLNSEADNVLVVPHLMGQAGGCSGGACSIPQLRIIAASLVDGAKELHSTLTPTDPSCKKTTGPTQTFDHPRLQSPAFSLTLPATDNLYQFFGVNVSGKIAPAVADGNYSLVPGTNLTPGHYLLQFGGSNANGTFIEVITYQITVTP